MVEAAETSSSSSPMAAGGDAVTPPPPKKKRNLPGMPDPEAQVIALSPKTLLATNRFVCEICNKGFQRDQNLQLHRRGHNLPWKLKQRTNDEPPRKRVYVCPEPTCVHHSPARALGDLTGIKKHFCRKHGDKKWKCQRCSKRYAVMSDWKAHMKTCGTREYRCDCGTLFSRRDSFITHRAFCDALAEESARTSRSHNQTQEVVGGKEAAGGVVEAPVSSSPPPPPLTPSTTVVSPGLSVQSSELAENPMGVSPPTPAATCLTVTTTAVTSMSSATSSSNHIPPNVFNSTPATAVLATISQQSHIPSASFSRTMCSLSPVDCPAVMPTPGLAEPPSLSLSPSLYLSDNPGTLFLDHRSHHYAPSPQPAMSATALLQKAAQMGATTSNPSFLRGLGLQVSGSSGQDSNANQWDIKPDSRALASGLGLGLASNNADVMLSSTSLFGNNKPTLDFLGLGVGANSVLLSSYTGGFNVGATAGPGSYNGGGVGGSSDEIWDGRLPERKPNGSALL